MHIKTNILSIKIFLSILFLPLLLSANETISQLESRLDKAQSDSLRIELLLLMGDQFEHNDFDAALHFYHQALNLTEVRLNQPGSRDEKNILEHLRLKALRYIAKHYNSWGKYDHASQAYKELGQAYLRVNDMEGHIRTIFSKGNMYYYQGLYPQALEYYNNAGILAEQNNLYDIIANLKLNMGMSYYLLGNYIQSLSYLQQSLELYDSLGIEIHKGSIYLGKGNIFSELSDFNNAIKNYNLALEHFTKYPDNNAFANVHISIGALYYDFNMNDEAEKHYLEALDHAILLRSNRMEAHTMLNLGQVYIRKKEFDKALNYFNQAMVLAEETNNKHIKSNILRNLARLYIAKGNYSIAYRNASESLQIGQSIESVSVQSLSFGVLSEIREKEGMFEDALQYYKQYKTLNDSLLDIEKQRKLTEMDALYQSEKQMQAMELKRLELEKSKGELKQKKLLANTFIGAFALVVIFGIVTFIFNNRRIKTDRLVKRQNKVIEKTNEKFNQLTTQSELQNRRIMQLEKEIAIHEKNLYNDHSFAEEINSFMLPGLDVLPASFDGRAFMFSNTKIESKKPGFLWVKQHEDTIAIALAGCNLPSIKGSLVNLYLSLLLEKFSQNIYLKDPRIIAENINEQIKLLSNQMNINHSPINISLLWINRKNQKIVFSGERIELYLAIARMRKEPTQNLSFEYQGLQKLNTHKSSETSDNVVKNRYAPGVQLKKADRLYLIGHCKAGSAEESKKSGNSFTENEIIPLLDDFQEKEINLHKTFLASYFAKRKESDEMPDNLNIIGIEL